MAKRIGIDGALKQARSELYGKGGPKEDALRSTYRAPSALPAAAMAVNTLADKDLWASAEDLGGEGGPAEVTPKQPLFQAKDHLELEYRQKRANEEPWITERRKQVGGFTDEEERFLVDSARRRAEAQKRLASERGLDGEGGPADYTRTLSPEDREFFAEHKAAQQLSRARNVELRSQHQELIAAGRYSEAAELLASVAADRDVPKYMPGDSELGGGSVAMPWAKPAESRQDARFAAEQDSRAVRGRSEYFMDSLAGMLPTAAVVGGMLPEGLPGSRPTELLRNPTWRSDAGRAGAAMRKVVDPMRRAWPGNDAINLKIARDRVGALRYGWSPQIQAAANARTIARETAKKVVPMATAGAAAYAAPALTAGLVAAPLFAAPLNFVFGEGEGSYAQTQDFKSQVDALARLKGGPLDVRDLEPEFFERLAGEPGIADGLIQSGTLSDESIDELGYWRGRARERDEAGEVARLRSLGMLDSEDDDVVRKAMGTTYAWMGRDDFDYDAEARRAAAAREPVHGTWDSEVYSPEFEAQMARDLADASPGVQRYSLLRSGDSNAQRRVREARWRQDEQDARRLERGEAGIQPAISDIQRERQMAEDAERNPAGFDAWSERVRRPYGE